MVVHTVRNVRGHARMQKLQQKRQAALAIGQNLSA